MSSKIFNFIVSPVPTSYTAPIVDFTSSLISKVTKNSVKISKIPATSANYPSILSLPSYSSIAFINTFDEELTSSTDTTNKEDENSFVNYPYLIPDVHTTVVRPIENTVGASASPATQRGKSIYANINKKNKKPVLVRTVFPLSVAAASHFAKVKEEKDALPYQNVVMPIKESIDVIKGITDITREVEAVTRSVRRSAGLTKEIGNKIDASKVILVTKQMTAYETSNNLFLTEAEKVLRAEGGVGGDKKEHKGGSSSSSPGQRGGGNTDGGLKALSTEIMNTASATNMLLMFPEKVEMMFLNDIGGNHYCVSSGTNHMLLIERLFAGIVANGAPIEMLISPPGTEREPARAVDSTFLGAYSFTSAANSAVIMLKELGLSSEAKMIEKAIDEINGEIYANFIATNGIVGAAGSSGVMTSDEYGKKLLGRL